MLKNVEVKTYIEEQLNKMASKSVADAEEVMKYLTSVLRGESSSEEIVVEGCGDGYIALREWLLLRGWKTGGKTAA